MIELNNISKRYSSGTETFTALENISLKIAKGDFCSVIGASGAGKSTLLYLIGGLVHPDSGTVMYNGHDIYKMNVREANRYRKIHLGFMFQQFHLMPWLTVAGNISLACYRKNQREKINFYLEKCLLYGMQNKFPSELSVGEKQRTAFIRAVISSPDILLADEPTGNLDAGNSEILMSLVKEYQQNGGTVVLVSHDPDITRYSNMSVTLEKGIVV
jgi:putative ABC transport system ATP-binding protein